MSRFNRLIAGILLVLLAAIVGWRLIEPQEPSYGGKNLTAWLRDLGSTQVPVREAAAEAVRRIGTNGVPKLVGLCRSDDSVMRTALTRWLPQRVLTRLPAPAGELRWPAVKAFGLLGSSARSAIPELGALLRRGKNPGFVASALAAIGPESVGSLAQALTNPNAMTRFAAAGGLLQMGSAASPAVPALIQSLQDSDLHVRLQSAVALSAIGAAPELVVPALVPLLQDTNSLVRTSAAGAMGTFGSPAILAIPALLEALKDRDPDVRQSASNALTRIDPQALRRAGAK